jgi:hypothetical protein
LYVAKTSAVVGSSQVQADILFSVHAAQSVH